MSTQSHEILILGGGASGLSLSILTGAPVIEKEAEPGGHALSKQIDGYTFDRGPHIMFSRSELLLSCMVGSLGDNVHRCVRNNKVSIGDRLIKYPIENDLGSLQHCQKVECLTDYVKAKIRQETQVEKPANLAEWFTESFGKGLTDLYFRPYNEKVWKTSLEELSMIWSERIPAPPLDDVLKSAFGESTEGYLHQLHYHYPRVGGYSSLMNAWARGIPKTKLHLSTNVTKIIPQKGKVYVETSNTRFESEKVVSTLPLTSIRKLIDEIPTEVSRSIDRLRTNATVIVTMAFRGVDDSQWTAVYVPDKDFLPNRVSYPAVFSPENAPTGKFLVQSEIIIPTLKDVQHLDDKFFETHVYNGLKNRRLIPNEAVLESTYIDRYELAYVVYTEGFEKDVEIVTTWADSIGVILHGRFGSHNYLNVDGCLEQSIKLARNLGFNLSDSEILARFKCLGEKNDDQHI